MFFRSGGIDPGRDGCRVPLPWSGDEPPFGFSPAGQRQPGCRSRVTGRRSPSRPRRPTPTSMLSLYRDALADPPNPDLARRRPLELAPGRARRPRLHAAAPASPACVNLGQEHRPAATRRPRPHREQRAGRRGPARRHRGLDPASAVPDRPHPGHPKRRCPTRRSDHEVHPHPRGGGRCRRDNGELAGRMQFLVQWRVRGVRFRRRPTPPPAPLHPAPRLRPRAPASRQAR